MHTHRVMKGRFPYCPVPSGLSPEEEGREVRGIPHCHPCSEEKRAVRSSSWPPADLLGHLVLSGERWHFRQRASVRAAASAGWRAWPCGLRGRRLRASSFLELITESQLLSVLPDEPSCRLALNQSHTLFQANTEIS